MYPIDVIIEMRGVIIDVQKRRIRKAVTGKGRNLWGIRVS